MALLKHFLGLAKLSLKSVAFLALHLVEATHLNCVDL